MDCTRRIEHHLNSFSTQCTYLQFCLESTYQDKVWPNKVCAIVWADNSWFISFCDKPSKTHDEGIGRQGVHDSHRYSCGQKAVENATLFLQLPELLYLKRFKEIHPKFRKWGCNLKWSAGWPAIKGGSGFSLFKNNILTKFALGVTKKPTSK